MFRLLILKKKNMYRNWFLFLIILLLGSACKGPQVTQVSFTNLEIAGVETEQAAAKIAELVAPYKTQMQVEMNAQIGEVAESLTKGSPESLLGNWVADVLAIQAAAYTGKPIDFAISNSGGLRIPELSAGPLYRGMIYELLPFDNMLVVLELSAEQVQKLANHMASHGGWPVSKGYKMYIKEQKGYDIRIADHLLADDRIYRVAMPDYIANGGDDCAFLVSVEQESTGILMRDAVIDFVEIENEQGEHIRSSLDGRIQRM